MCPFWVIARDVRIVKICRIVEYGIVPNIWDQKSFLPSVTLFSHPKKIVVPNETLNPNCVKQLSTTLTNISFLYDFLAANYSFFNFSGIHQLFLWPFRKKKKKKCPRNLWDNDQYMLFCWSHVNLGRVIYLVTSKQTISLHEIYSTPWFSYQLQGYWRHLFGGNHYISRGGGLGRILK